MVSLHQTQASWNREERERINENWQRIAESFAAVQRQITILTGGEEIEDLLTRIEQALNNAETSVQQFINQVDTEVQKSLSTVSQALGELTQVISAAETVTADTTAAKNAAVQATKDAEAAIANMQGLIDNFKPRGEWSSTVTYYANNLVEDDGRTYIALKENINTPVTDKNTWAIFADKGAKGDPGEKGDPGAGLNIIGSLTDPSQLPETGTEGDAYTINGNLWIWNGTTWENVGNIRGEQGLSAYQVAVNSGFEGTEEEWLASLKGAQGDIGPQGPQGPPGQIPDLENYATVEELSVIDKKIPNKTSQLINDTGFLTTAPVTSVNGQTGAVTIPSGGVVESGSNENGIYVRFSDGTQICLISKAFNLSSSTAQTFIPPATFKENTMVSGSFSIDDSANGSDRDSLTRTLLITYQKNMNGSPYYALQINSANTSATTKTIGIYLVGRWK